MSDIGNKRERFVSPAPEECVAVIGTQKTGDGRVIIFYDDNSYLFRPVVRPQ